MPGWLESNKCTRICRDRFCEVIKVDEMTAKKCNLASLNTKLNAFRKINTILNYALEKDDAEMAKLLDKSGKEVTTCWNQSVLARLSGASRC